MSKLQGLCSEPVCVPLEGAKGVADTVGMLEDESAGLQLYLAKFLVVTYLYMRRHSPERVEPASPIALTTSRTEALQSRRPYASSLETFTQLFLHRAWPKTCGPEIGSKSVLFVVAHVFSWPPARRRHVGGGVGRRMPLISSPSEHLAAWPNQRSLL